MKYINKKTQAVIETACELKGGAWEKTESEQPKAPAKAAAGKKKQKKAVKTE